MGTCTHPCTPCPAAAWQTRWLISSTGSTSLRCTPSLCAVLWSSLSSSSCLGCGHGADARLQAAGRRILTARPLRFHAAGRLSSTLGMLLSERVASTAKQRPTPVWQWQSSERPAAAATRAAQQTCPPCSKGSSACVWLSQRRTLSCWTSDGTCSVHDRLPHPMLPRRVASRLNLWPRAAGVEDHVQLGAKLAYLVSRPSLQLRCPFWLGLLTLCSRRAHID